MFFKEEVSASDKQSKASKWKQKRNKFYKYAVYNSSHLVMFLDGNEGIKCLFAKTIENMFLIFKSKQKNNKTNQH